jgi:hypothetical protein
MKVTFKFYYYVLNKWLFIKFGSYSVKAFWAPVHSWRSHQRRVKGRTQVSLSFWVSRIEETGGLASVITKSRSLKYHFGEGCGHISDHEGVSWCLVLGCTGVTHKDLWIHTCVCMCGVSCREIKESI